MPNGLVKVRCLDVQSKARRSLAQNASLQGAEAGLPTTRNLSRRDIAPSQRMRQGAVRQVYRAVYGAMQVDLSIHPKLVCLFTRHEKESNASLRSPNGWRIAQDAVQLNGDNQPRAARAFAGNLIEPAIESIEARRRSVLHEAHGWELEFLPALLQARDALMARQSTGHPQ